MQTANKTVLVVDSRHASREALSLALIADDHAVIEAEDYTAARQVFEMARRALCHIDLVILDGDSQIKVEDFIQLLNQHMPGLPFLLLTGWGDEIPSDVEYSSFSTMAKPFGADQLIASINQTSLMH